MSVLRGGGRGAAMSHKDTPSPPQDPLPSPAPRSANRGSRNTFAEIRLVASAAQSFSRPPRAVSRGRGRLCDPEIVSVGGVLGGAWRVRAASQTPAPYAVHGLSSLGSLALTACKVGGREAPRSDVFRGPPRGGGRAAGGNRGPALSAGLPASKVLWTEAPPRDFNSGDIFLSGC